MSKKYLSKKYSKIFTFNTVLKTFNDHSKSKDKLIIHTSNGLYIGNLREPIDANDLTLNDNDDFSTVYNKMYISALNKYESNENSEISEITENPITIELEDVLVVTNATRIKMPFVEIFVDQIIGFSYGSIDL